MVWLFILFRFNKKKKLGTILNIVDKDTEDTELDMIKVKTNLIINSFINSLHAIMGSNIQNTIDN